MKMNKLDLTPVFEVINLIRIEQPNWQHEGLGNLFFFRIMKIETASDAIDQFGNAENYYRFVHSCFESFFTNLCPVLSETEKRFFKAMYQANLPVKKPELVNEITKPIYNIAKDVFDRFLNGKMSKEARQAMQRYVLLIDKPESFDNESVLQHQVVRAKGIVGVLNQTGNKLAGLSKEIQETLDKT